MGGRAQRLPPKEHRKNIVLVLILFVSHLFFCALLLLFSLLFFLLLLVLLSGVVFLVVCFKLITFSTGIHWHMFKVYFLYSKCVQLVFLLCILKHMGFSHCIHTACTRYQKPNLLQCWNLKRVLSKYRFAPYRFSLIFVGWAYGSPGRTIDYWLYSPGLGLLGFTCEKTLGWANNPLRG